jgi:hypothetical protein
MSNHIVTKTKNGETEYLLRYRLSETDWTSKKEEAKLYTRQTAANHVACLTEYDSKHTYEHRLP